MIVDAVPSRAAAGVVPSPWMPPAKIPTGQRTRRQRIFGSLAASNLQGGRNQGQSGSIRANQRTSELQRTSEVHQRYIRGHQRPSEPCIRGTRRSSDEAIRGPLETIRGPQRSSEVIRDHQRTQRSSDVIRCQRSSEVIRGHQRSSEGLRCHCQQRSSVAHLRIESHQFANHSQPSRSRARCEGAKSSTHLLATHALIVLWHASLS